MEFKNLDLEVFFIRHGEAIGNQGHWINQNAPLNDLGIIQVQQTAKLVKNLKFNKFFTSPLLRAKQTAEIVRNNNISFGSLVQSSWLSEIDLGVWAGKSKEECLKILPHSLQLFLSKNYNNRGPLVSQLLRFQKNFKFPEGESLLQFWRRVTNGFIQVLNSFHNLKRQRIALIGHGGSFSIALLILLKRSFEDTEFPIFVIGLGDFLAVKIINNQVMFQHLNLRFNQNNSKNKHYPINRP